tara:strand:- start:153 stop:656 length:504 start_codon:yes stop_codon:yes gene_type:complete
MGNFKMSGFPKHKTGVQLKGSPVLRSATETQTMGASATSGAMQGASAGAMFGPWGMAIGAVAGGAYGLYQGDKANKAAAAEKIKADAEATKQRAVDMKVSRKKKELENQQAKQVGVVNFTSAPPPAEITPTASSTQDLGALYSPTQKMGNIKRLIENNKRIHTLKNK